jgi:AbrB family looped-hinge helix DNA binding protein
MASVLTVDRKGRTTLPEDVRNSLRLRPGDFLLLEKTDRGTYELVPASLVPRDQLWFHHPEMQKRVAEAEAEFSAGRVTRTKSPKAAQAFLDRLKKRSRRRR